MFWIIRLNRGSNPVSQLLLNCANLRTCLFWCRCVALKNPVAKSFQRHQCFMARKNSDIQASAKKLRKLTPFSHYGYIDVPQALVGDSADFRAAYDAIIQPHWDQMVGILREKNGYSELLAMLVRLREKRGRAEKGHARTEQILNRIQMAFNLFRHEAAAADLDETVGKSLGFKAPLKETKPEWWAWSVIQLGSSWENEPVHLRYKYFARTSKEFQAFFSADEMPDFAQSIDGEETWRDVIDRTGKRGKLYSEQVDKYRGLLDIIKFRLAIIEAVLYEFELLGYVGDYAPNNPQIQSVPDEIKKFEEDTIVFKIMEKGLEIYKTNPAAYKNRSTLLNDLLPHFPYDSKRGLEKLLDRKGCYNTKDPGRSTPENEEEHLLELIEMWRQATGRF